MTIASFHLVTFDRAATAMARLATDRVRLRQTDGLRFVRVLGTGRDDDTGPSIDPHRTAMFAVWDDDAALAGFLADHPVAGGWRAASEAWHVRLRSLGGHGRWRGFPVLDGVSAGSTVAGPVAVLTRADVRLRAWRSFARVSRSVSDELRGAEGLLAVVGVGEAPVGRLGTFSLWSSAAAAETYATTAHHHADAAGRARADGWFREELFARFEPIGATGSWGGRDPLDQPE